MQKIQPTFEANFLPLFSLAVMAVIWQILSWYWCWSLLQTQRGRGAGGPGGRDLSVPSHARPRHPGHLAGGAGGAGGPGPGLRHLHPAPASEQGQDHERQQGDHEETAGACNLHRKYSTKYLFHFHVACFFLNAVFCAGFICFHFNWEQPRWCRIFAGLEAGLKSIFLHDYCTIIHQLPSPGQRWAACIPTSYIRPENCPRTYIRAIGFFADIFCFCTQLKRKRKPWYFDLLTRYPICCTDWKTCWENFSNYFVWELTNVYTLHRQL